MPDTSPADKPIYMNATKTTELTNIAEPKKAVYTAKAHTTGGRDGGASRTSDGRDVVTNLI